NTRIPWSHHRHTPARARHLAPVPQGSGAEHVAVSARQCSQLNWIVDGKRPHPLGGTVSACTALASAARRRSMSGSGPILLPALAAYWQKLLGTLASQAEEVRALS